MKVIDLTQPLYDGMPVYPGDPEVEINEVFALAKDGWNMARMSMATHIATHVNVPVHAVKNGKSLDDYSLGAFFGETVVYEELGDVKRDLGLIFTNKKDLNDTVAEQIIAKRPQFVGIPGYFEADGELEIEKLFLKNEIISFEGLVNTDKLPKESSFVFYGLPLKIKEGDGSPVRAMAILD